MIDYGISDPAAFVEALYNDDVSFDEILIELKGVSLD